MHKDPSARASRRSARVLPRAASFLALPVAALAVTIPAATGASATATPVSGRAVTAHCAAKSAGAERRAVSSSPSVVEHFTAGGARYVYDIGTQQLSFPILPAHFDAKTAGPAQLAQYGLSAEPAKGPARAAWLSLVADLHHQSAPELAVRSVGRPDAPGSATVSPGRTGNPARGGIFGGVNSGTSHIWSGYVSYLAGETTHYSEAVGQWSEDFSGPTSCSGATHLTWVGVGGWATGQLLQVGTDQNNDAWYEWLGPNGVPRQFFPNNLTVNAGDTIFAYVTYIPQSDGGGAGGTAWFVVVDKTTDQYTIASLSNAGQDWDGSSAEFVDERTTFANGPSPLANYYETLWTDAAAESLTDNGPVPLANLGHVLQVNMIDPSNNDLLASASAEGDLGTVYIDWWDRCS
jgi:hypothetical protein